MPRTWAMTRTRTRTYTSDLTVDNGDGNDIDNDDDNDFLEVLFEKDLPKATKDTAGACFRQDGGVGGVVHPSCGEGV